MLVYKLDVGNGTYKHGVRKHFGVDSVYGQFVISCFVRSGHLSCGDITIYVCRQLTSEVQFKDSTSSIKSSRSEEVRMYNTRVWHYQFVGDMVSRVL